MRFPSRLPWLLGLLTAIGPASIDMYLPAFPAIEASFQGPPGSAQLTLASYFAGLAVGQITQGSLSDRFRPAAADHGRDHHLCAVSCALSPSIRWLALFRAISAFGAAASTVIPRAIVRDLATGHAAAMMMSQLTLVLGAAPILAPSIGGAVLIFANWRWIFWILALYALFSCIMVRLLLPETLPPERRLRLRLNEQLRRFRTILGEPTFASHAAMGCFASFAFFTYLGGSSPVFIRGFHLSPSLYAVIFGVCSMGLIACSQINARILPRFGVSRVLHAVARVHLSATLALTIIAFSGMHSFVLVSLPIFVAVSCMGFLNPNAVVGALSHHGQHAGSASALMGTGQFLLGAVGGLLVGIFTDGTPRGMAALMLLGSVALVMADLCRPRPEGAIHRIRTVRPQRHHALAVQALRISWAMPFAGDSDAIYLAARRTADLTGSRPVLAVAYPDTPSCVRAGC